MPKNNPPPTTRRPITGTAAPDEVSRFSALSDEWWDADGKFRPLHQINPTRIAFIRDRVAGHFSRDPLGRDALGGPGPLDGLDVLDIGCGGGLLGEPMRRLGARVTGIDAGEETVRVAALHAKQGGLDIEYRCVLPETLAADGRTFDVILNMEVIEHVADVGAFLAACCAMVKPGGVMVISTLNRTLKSFALAKVGAEYVLRWLPAGTHDWRKFVKPWELAAGLRPQGFDIVELKGLAYRPLSDEWLLVDNVDVNYMAIAVKR